MELVVAVRVVTGLGVRVGVAVDVRVGVGDGVPPEMVRSVVPCWPLQVKVTSYIAPGLASQKMEARADPPEGMGVSSKTPDSAVAVLLQLVTVRVTWPPAAITEGVTAKPNGVGAAARPWPWRAW